MSEYIVTDTELTGIANAIRTKGGTSAPLEFPGDFVDAIDDISTGTDTSDATATAGDILSGKTAYIATGKATGTIPSKSSSDLTASGDTVSVPAGYYASAASKAVAAGSINQLVATKGRVSNNSINITPRVQIVGGYLPSGDTHGNAATVTAAELVSGTKTITGSGTTDVTNYADASVAAGSAATPATTITANPTISVNSSTGVITATASASQSVTPSVSAGWVSSGTAGTVTVSGSNTQQLSTQAAQTITPGTTDQTIASGKYLTGAQTIKGDADLVAANIAKGVSIFGVTGTHEGGGGGYTLVFQKELSINTSSTATTTVAEYDTTVSDIQWGENKLLVSVALAKEGKRTGYHVGTIGITTGTGSSTGGVGTTYRYQYYAPSNSVAVANQTAYGVMVNYTRNYSNMKITINSRYSGSYTKTINGTYDIRVYAIDYPPNGNPFDYSFS